MASGSHTFQVQATDAANNTDPTPASFTWTINPFDLDIRSLRVTNRTSVIGGREISLTLVVENNGSVQGAAPTTIVGVQNGFEVYNQTMNVSVPVGGRMSLQFPPFVATNAGFIVWTATISDVDPDIDIATAETFVAPPPGRGN